MTIQRMTPIAAVLVGAASPAYADPGLSSLKGLIPLYVAAAVVFVLAFYVWPVWLIFRAQKKFAEGRLSRKQLLLLLFPAALVGLLGLVDFLGPIGLVSSLFYDLGGARALSVYPVFVVFSAFLVYRAWSTYQSCKRLPEA